MNGPMVTVRLPRGGVFTMPGRMFVDLKLKVTPLVIDLREAS